MHVRRSIQHFKCILLWCTIKDNPSNGSFVKSAQYFSDNVEWYMEVAMVHRIVCCTATCATNTQILSLCYLILLRKAQRKDKIPEFKTSHSLYLFIVLLSCVIGSHDCICKSWSKLCVKKNFRFCNMRK